MLKVATALPHEPYREYKDVERVYSGSTEIDKILDKNGNVLFAVNKEVEGTPVLTYKGKEETNLKNYRIYGNTVNGESVGDRTGNLFDGYRTTDIINNSYIDKATGNIISNNDYYISYPIAVIANQNYVWTFNSFRDSTFWKHSSPTVGFYDVNNVLISAAMHDNSINSFMFTVPDNCSYIRASVYKINSANKTEAMLNTGSEPLPYEPCGYKVPVTIEGKNLCNNIWEQKMINAETGNTSPSEKTVCCDFIPVKPNVTYSCSRTIANDYNNLRCYGANKNYLGTGADLVNKANPLKQGELFGTFMITDARVSYIRFNDLSNSLDTKYMLVEGVYTAETMPPYEPYHAPITTPIYLPEPIKMVGNEAEYIDYGEQKLHRVRKNLLQNTATSQTINGVTLTGNSDGSITCNGTASDNILVNIIPSPLLLPEGAYILNGAPPGGGQSYNFKLDVRVSTSVSTIIYYPDIGNGIQFNILQTEKIVMCRIAIYSGYTCDNLTFYPMIRKADIEDDTYEPYIKNVDLDVTLPALPTLTGTNTLTVGTEVQPSNVYLKGRIKEVS